MNKAELIEVISNEAGITKAKAKEVLEVTLGSIQQGINKSGKVTLKGFGNFTKTARKARTGRNPQTGEAIEIPAKEVVKFKAQF